MTQSKGILCPEVIRHMSERLYFLLICLTDTIVTSCSSLLLSPSCFSHLLSSLHLTPSLAPLLHAAPSPCLSLIAVSPPYHPLHLLLHLLLSGDLSQGVLQQFTQTWLPKSYIRRRPRATSALITAHFTLNMLSRDSRQSGTSGRVPHLFR